MHTQKETKTIFRDATKENENIGKKCMKRQEIIISIWNQHKDTTHDVINKM